MPPEVQPERGRHRIRRVAVGGIPRTQREGVEECVVGSSCVRLLLEDGGLSIASELEVASLPW